MSFLVLIPVAEGELDLRPFGMGRGAITWIKGGARREEQADSNEST